jgi:hypothetical protein
VPSLHHLLIKGLTYPSFGTKPGESYPLIRPNPLGIYQHDLYVQMTH